MLRVARRLLGSCAILLFCANAQAAPVRYEKMVRRIDLVKLKAGDILEPRFAKTMMAGAKIEATFGKQSTFQGPAVEKLFADTLVALKKEGLVRPDLPGRTDGVFVTTDLRKFPEFMKDLRRARVILAPVDPKRVATYDRRFLLSALAAFDRAAKAKSESERERHVAKAAQLARRYFLERPRASDKNARPEILLGGGAKILEILR